MTKSSGSRVGRKVKLGLVKSNNIKANAKSKFTAQELLVRKLMATKKTIKNIEKTCKIYKNAMEGITGEFNCRQFQMIGQDLESILVHIQDLEDNGPDKAHDEIPLEDSEESVPEEKVPTDV